MAFKEAFAFKEKEGRTRDCRSPALDPPGNNWAEELAKGPEGTEITVQAAWNRLKEKKLGKLDTCIDVSFITS